MRRTLPLPPVLSILALACAQLLWVGCGDGGDPAGVSDKTLATVGVEPSGVALTGVGATHQFSAEGYNRSGQRLTPPVVTWSSLNPFVATVDSGTGRVTAVSAGQATIAATTDGVVDYGLVTVSIPDLNPAESWISIPCPGGGHPVVLRHLGSLRRRRLHGGG
ncbi:Ig-like domain-containing protein [Gemmatimonadota bacterium]